jgi:hypothetical protein
VISSKTDHGLVAYRGSKLVEAEDGEAILHTRIGE